MMRTLCFSFLVLASSQMVMSSQPVVEGTLFGKWCCDGPFTGSKTKAIGVAHNLILSSAPFKHAIVCTSGFVAGATLAMGVSPLSPLLSVATAASLYVGRDIIIGRYNVLSEARNTFNGNPDNKPAQFNFDHNRVMNQACLKSLLLPVFIGIAGVVLYSFASRYQFKILPR